jgi:hypothetical protein
LGYYADPYRNTLGLPILAMQPIRKPRVFLSHSKKDVDFIRRLDTDLRASQCEPWIDEVELRAGQPWLDQIFGSGIPSCEIVLCYYTPNSAESAVFMQELDARLIERLHNSRVTLLLYVSSSALRSRLRLDLQRLQVPEINDANYASEFPRLVAEVWRSYAETLVQVSIDAERVKRLEAELRVRELEGEASTSIFTAAEQAEFKAIWAEIDKRLVLQADVVAKSKTSAEMSLKNEAEEDRSICNQAATHRFILNSGQLFRSVVLKQKYQPSSYQLHLRVERDIHTLLRIEGTETTITFELPFDLEADLLRFGFVERHYSQPATNGSSGTRLLHQPVKLVFTSKFDRFGFWIDNNFGKLQTETSVVYE